VLLVAAGRTTMLWVNICTLQICFAKLSSSGGGGGGSSSSGGTAIDADMMLNNDSDNDKPIKSLLKGKGLLPPVGLARLDSWGEL
jgi:hypothetical protein